MICFVMTGFGQTWHVGYPNETDVIATLSDGTMTISGTGKMNTYLDFPPPWAGVKNQIQSVIIEDGITAIGERAFDGYSSITYLSIGSTVKFIDWSAFYGCSIPIVTIPEGVEDIGGKAFGWGAVTSLVIPKSVKGIYTWAFGGNTNLSEISVSWNSPEDVFISSDEEDDPFLEIEKGNVILHVPVGKKEVYEASNYWKDFHIVDDGKVVGVNNAQLANLTVSAGTISPEFNPNRLNYTVSVPQSIENITLTATPVEGCSVSGDGRKTLETGPNSFEIIVTDTESSTIYTVSVIRVNSDFLLQSINCAEVATGSLTTTYYDLVTKKNETVSLIDQYEVEYELSTGNISGNLTLHFDMENEQKTIDVVANVAPNSIYRFTLYVAINYIIGDISTTTHFDNFGQPSSTILNYRRHLCNIVASEGNEVLSTTEINRVGSTTKSISISDITFVGNGNFSSIQDLSISPSISVFPNPANDFIQISGLQGNETLYIYTVNGQLLLSRKANLETEKISVQHLAPGIYFLKTNAGETVKWIKK